MRRRYTYIHEVKCQMHLALCLYNVFFMGCGRVEWSGVNASGCAKKPTCVCITSLFAHVTTSECYGFCLDVMSYHPHISRGHTTILLKTGLSVVPSNSTTVGIFPYYAPHMTTVRCLTLPLAPASRSSAGRRRVHQ